MTVGLLRVPDVGYGKLAVGQTAESDGSATNRANQRRHAPWCWPHVLSLTTRTQIRPQEPYFIMNLLHASELHGHYMPPLRDITHHFAPHLRDITTQIATFQQVMRVALVPK